VQAVQVVLRVVDLILVEREVQAVLGQRVEKEVMGLLV
jgi:hypothetical protein